MGLLYVRSQDSLTFHVIVLGTVIGRLRRRFLSSFVTDHTILLLAKTRKRHAVLN